MNGFMALVPMEKAEWVPSIWRHIEEHLCRSWFCRSCVYWVEAQHLTNAMTVQDAERSLFAFSSTSSARSSWKSSCRQLSDRLFRIKKSASKLTYIKDWGWEAQLAALIAHTSLWASARTRSPFYAPTLAYSMTSSHSRKILHCSAGFFGSRNDKTISKHDSFIEEIRSNDIYTKFEWTMNVDENTTRVVKGVFLLCDGGYHKWAQMVCPLKHTSKLGHTLWSCQLESVRKDIECTFGILKVRFRVLQHPLPYMAKDWNTYRSKIDNIVWSCCILHNMLLKHDGLEFLWTDADYLSVWYVCSCVVEHLHAIARS